MSELKKVFLGLLIDGACIGAMLMQVQHPGTYWDYLGSVGYFAQVASIWIGFVFCLLFMAAAAMLRDLPRPRTEPEARAAEGLRRFSANSLIYRRWVTTKEISICAIFAGMGWVWLAIGNLIVLLMLQQAWYACRQVRTA